MMTDEEIMKQVMSLLEEWQKRDKERTRGFIFTSLSDADKDESMCTMGIAGTFQVLVGSLKHLILEDPSIASIFREVVQWWDKESKKVIPVKPNKTKS